MADQTDADKDTKGPLALLDSESEEVAEQRKRLEALLNAIGLADAALLKKQEQLKEARSKVEPHVGTYQDLSRRVRTLEEQLATTDEELKQAEFEQDEYSRRRAAVTGEIQTLKKRGQEAAAAGKAQFEGIKTRLREQYSLDDTENELKAAQEELKAAKDRFTRAKETYDASRNPYEAEKKAAAESISVNLKMIRTDIAKKEGRLEKDIEGITKAQETARRVREETGAKYEILQQEHAELAAKLAELESHFSETDTGVVTQVNESAAQLADILSTSETDLARLLGFVRKEDGYVLAAGGLQLRALPAPKREDAPESAASAVQAPAADEKEGSKGRGLGGAGNFMEPEPSRRHYVQQSPLPEDEPEVIIEELTGEQLAQVAAQGGDPASQPPAPVPVVEAQEEEPAPEGSVSSPLPQAALEPEDAMRDGASGPGPSIPAARNEDSTQFNIVDMAAALAAQARAATPTPDPVIAPPVSIVPQGIVRVTEDILTRWKISYLIPDSTSERRSVQYVDGMSFLTGLRQVVQTLFEEIEGTRYNTEKLTKDDIAAISRDSQTFADAFADMTKALGVIVGQYNKTLEDVVYDHVMEKQPISKESLARLSYRTRTLVLGEQLREALFGSESGLLIELLDIEQLDRIFNDMPIPEADDSPEFIDMINLKELSAKLETALNYVNNMYDYGHRTAAGLQAIEELAKYMGEKS